MNKPKLPKKLENMIQLQILLAASLNVILRAEKLKTPDDLRVEYYICEVLGIAAGIVSPGALELMEQGLKDTTLSLEGHKRALIEQMIMSVRDLQDYLADEIDFY